MLKCPYCYDELSITETKRCPHCSQFLIDPVLDLPYPSVEKKDCLFCGKKILKEAIFCRFCRKWLDDLTRAIDAVVWDD